MEYKDPVFELLSSPEHIVLRMIIRNLPQTVSPLYLVNLNSCVKALDLRLTTLPTSWA